MAEDRRAGVFWGSPSQQWVEKLVRAVRGHGFGCFVIDCGWYKAEGVP